MVSRERVAKMAATIAPCNILGGCLSFLRICLGAGGIETPRTLSTLDHMVQWMIETELVKEVTAYFNQRLIRSSSASVSAGDILTYSFNVERIYPGQALSRHHAEVVVENENGSHLSLAGWGLGMRLAELSRYYPGLVITRLIWIET